MKKIIIVFLILIAVIAAVLWYTPSPPDAGEIGDFIARHREDIESVNAALLNSEKESVLLIPEDGFALSKTEITDPAAREHLINLWNDGCLAVSKNTERNAIKYTVWQRTKDEADCGFVYAIDKTRSPEVEFKTELTPMSEEGWYYFLSEYNKWRAMR